MMSSYASPYPTMPAEQWRAYRPSVCHERDCGFSYDVSMIDSGAVLEHVDGLTGLVTHFPISERMLADVYCDIWGEFRQKIVALHCQSIPEEGVYVYE